MGPAGGAARRAATAGVVRDLALLQPGPPVLSLHLRTDPRDEANNAATPGWLVGMRNGLRAIARRLDESGPREHRLALRDLRRRLEMAVLDLGPAERGRGLSWFVTPDGVLDRRLTLHLPPRGHIVMWDPRPFVAPLVDVTDRGRPAGLVLVSGEAVRLLHWEAGRVDEPGRSLYHLELGEGWRHPVGYAVRYPRRRSETYDARVAVWREKFLHDAAIATAARLAELGWDRLVLAGEPTPSSQFAARLPLDLRDRLVARVEANLLWEDKPAIAERFEAPLEEAWRRETLHVAEKAIAAARAGGPGAVGWVEVLDALLQDRVRYLVFAADVAPDPASLPPAITDALGRPSAALLVERAIEQAIASGADVAAVPGTDSGQLSAVGGVAAALRF
jgi:hypothetical protein